MSDTTNPCVALREMLIASSTVRNLVDDRIRPDALDEDDTRPSIRYELIATERLRNLDGTAPMQRSRIQVDSYATVWDDCYDIAAAAIGVLDGYRGAASGLFFHDVAIENEYDGKDIPPPGSSQWRHRRTFDAVIVHSVSS